MSEKDLDKDMLAAQQEEMARQERLRELKKSLLRENAAAASAKSGASVSSTSTSTSTAVTEIKKEPETEESSPGKEKDTQLKSLLQGTG